MEGRKREDGTPAAQFEADACEGFDLSVGMCGEGVGDKGVSAREGWRVVGWRAFSIPSIPSPPSDRHRLPSSSAHRCRASVSSHVPSRPLAARCFSCTCGRACGVGGMEDEPEGSIERASLIQDHCNPWPPRPRSPGHTHSSSAQAAEGQPAVLLCDVDAWGRGGGWE